MAIYKRIRTKKKYGAVYFFFLLFTYSLSAQTDSSTYKGLPADTTSLAQTDVEDTAGQIDAIDVILKILKKKGANRSSLQPGKVSFVILPGLDYSSATGLVASVSADVSYYASDFRYQNLSTISAAVSYSQKQQKTASLYSNIWLKNNSYFFKGIAWYYRYLEHTYGLGGYTTKGKENQLNYQFVKFYESALKRIFKDGYAGLGYQLDYHYGITEGGNKDGSLSDYSLYSNKNKSVSSGPSIHFLFDNRRNPINPPKGTYLNLVYSPKLKALGSTNNWQSLRLDIRKYIKVAPHSGNVLAFWSLLSSTLGTGVPYLDMPSTGWDEQQNSGRGYTQGRFRGKNMLYLESEYRFGITRNGLLGGVVFANAQSFSEGTNNRFERILPAAGAGLRIKFNKYSRTNLCIDYGIGANGSRGIFVNVGEVF